MNEQQKIKKKINWKELSRLFSPSADEAEKARNLFISFEKNGYLKSSDFSLSHCSRNVIIDFYYRLSLIRSIESPVKRKKKSDWIHEKDFAFINHRASLFIDEYPFLSQLSTLPSVRAGSVILAPFTKNRKKKINTVDSHAHICEDFGDEELIEKGVSLENQFHLYIEAAHLLGKCVGYTLDYRVDRFSIPVLRRPDLFRWIDLKSTAAYMEMLEEKMQVEIIGHVQNIVGNYLNSLSLGPGENDYNNIRTLLKENGFWTIPSCICGNGQLPLYEYKENCSKPDFFGGDDDLTSFKFYKSDNSVNSEGLDYYSSLYTKWRDSFSFDFIKFSGIEFADDDKRKKGDSPSLDLIKKVIKKTTNKISHTGFLGDDVEHRDIYINSGFNTVFVHNKDNCINRVFMESNFNLNLYLQEINKKKKRQFSIAFSGGETNGESQSNMEDCCRRIFISRFISCFKAYRPKYEFWDDTINKKSLSDIPQYNMIENIFTRYREIVRKGKIVKHYIDENVSWWIIHYGANLLIPLISLDNDENSSPEKVSINYSGIINTSHILSVLEYDFTSSGGDLFLCGDEEICCEDLPSKGFKLFSVQ